MLKKSRLKRLFHFFVNDSDFYHLKGSTWDITMERVCNVVLCIFYVYFIYGQLSHRDDYLRWDIVIFTLKMTMEAIFFLSRKMPKNFSIGPYTWFVTLFAVNSVLLMRPEAPGTYFTAGLVLMHIGFILHIIALSFLGRSFGIIPANREIKTSGVYGFVRHPLYLSIFITITGYLIANPSNLNFAIYVSGIFFHILRIFE